jgi:ubiquinone/menaquinone biosynthesis C-methylase UbiE
MTSSSPRPPGQIDWSLGNYEHTAAQLLPAARAVVARAAPAVGERVVDVGCGTGNAALLAAASGGQVTGVDPASRLLEVARERATAEGVDVTFALGEAAALPIGDGDADVVLSVFGVIFAPDASQAAAELARITAPRGRIVLSAWLPEGAVFEAVRAATDAVRRAVDAPPAPPRFAWHDPDALSQLLAPYGFAVEAEQESIAFRASSPREYVDRESANHPLAIAARAVLGSGSEADALHDRMLSIYEAANEDPHGFRITSRYVVTSARRSVH